MQFICRFNSENVLYPPHLNVMDGITPEYVANANGWEDGTWRICTSDEVMALYAPRLQSDYDIAVQNVSTQYSTAINAAKTAWQTAVQQGESKEVIDPLYADYMNLVNQQKQAYLSVDTQFNLNTISSSLITSNACPSCGILTNERVVFGTHEEYVCPKCLTRWYASNNVISS